MGEQFQDRFLEHGTLLFFSGIRRSIEILANDRFCEGKSIGVTVATNLTGSGQHGQDGQVGSVWYGSPPGQERPVDRLNHRRKQMVLDTVGKGAETRVPSQFPATVSAAIESVQRWRRLYGTGDARAWPGGAV
jgi:hypothetical protein